MKLRNLCRNLRSFLGACETSENKEFYYIRIGSEEPFEEKIRNYRGTCQDSSEGNSEKNITEHNKKGLHTLIHDSLNGTNMVNQYD